MCMNTTEVIRLIVEAQRMKIQRDVEGFDKAVDALADELQKVCDGEVDKDALVHSFY